MLGVTYKDIPYIFTGLVVFVSIILAIVWIRTKSKEEAEMRAFNRQLKYAINPDNVEVNEQSNLSSKLDILPELMIKSGLSSKTTSVSEIKRNLMLIMSLAFLATLALSMNIMFAIFVPAIIYIGLYLISLRKLSQLKVVMNEQIPSFISTFKANIQANQHANNAMISAIDNTIEPLYSELAYAREIMIAGDFRSGIVMLRTTTEDETLRQLCSCIELANDVGANMEEQIDVIEEIIEDKQEIERKKRLGINENKPLFIASAVFIPGSFIGSYALSEMHKDYWFTTPMSFLILIGIIVIMGIAMYSTWKVIQNIDIG